MTYSKTEVVDAAREKFSFLVDDYDFRATIKEARGTYLSQIVFGSSYLEMFIGVWGQGNELWITLTPLIPKDVPQLEIENVLNGITNDWNYFDKNVSGKTTWPVFNHTFPQYFEVCALELKNHCRKIFAGDISQWIDIVKNTLYYRIERKLQLRQKSGALQLDDGDRKEFDPLVAYLRSINPDFSLSEIEYNVLDRLTR